MLLENWRMEPDIKNRGEEGQAANADGQCRLFLSLSSKVCSMSFRCPMSTQQLEIETDVYAITLGEAQIITTPGELFPEVFYGVENNRRQRLSGCQYRSSLTNPAVRDRMTQKYRFVMGLCPDELGYLVPGYDFLPPQGRSCRTNHSAGRGCLRDERCAEPLSRDELSFIETCRRLGVCCGAGCWKVVFRTPHPAAMWRSISIDEPFRVE